MDQRARELWLIPSVISLVSGIVFLIASLYVTAWATGVPLRHPFTLEWIESILFVRMPLWVFLLVLVATAAVMVYLRTRTGKRSALREAFVSQQSRRAEIRWPESPIVTADQPRKTQNPSERSASSFNGDSLVIDSPEQFSVRLSKFDNGAIRGIELRIENYRLTSIQRDRVVISDVRSFDIRHGAFREACVTGQVFAHTEVIRPSCSSNPTVLVWKAPQWPNLVTGDNNYVRRLQWPDMDKAEVETWKLSLRVNASESPQRANGQAIPLRELCTDVIVLWAKTRNELELEGLSPAQAPVSPAAFPLDGKDGTKRTIVRFIMCGHDQLLAYTTTRENLPGSRLLIVRVRPGQEPQSVETSDANVANAKWNEWYQEWRKKGLGGASGNGLDGASPF